MKIRRSYIAIQTCGFIDKSEYLAARACPVAWQPWVSARVGAISGWGCVRQLLTAPTPPVVSTHLPSWPGPCSGDSRPSTGCCGGRCLLRVAELPASVFCVPMRPPSLPCRPLSSPCLPADPGSTLQSLSGALLGGGVFFTISLSPVPSFHAGTFHLPSCIASVRSKSF